MTTTQTATDRIERASEWNARMISAGDYDEVRRRIAKEVRTLRRYARISEFERDRYNMRVAILALRDFAQTAFPKS